MISQLYLIMALEHCRLSSLERILHCFTLPL